MDVGGATRLCLMDADVAVMAIQIMVLFAAVNMMLPEAVFMAVTVLTILLGRVGWHTMLGVSVERQLGGVT